MLMKRSTPGPAIPGNRVTVYRDGDETFPAMIEAIRSAERYICLETYILRDDKTGWEFGAALADKARHGVEVSVLFDGFGSFGLGDQFREHLLGNGVRLHEYHPIMPWRKGFELNRRNHRKQLIVDGRVGFLGGINIGDEYRSHDGEPAWRDTHVRVEGPAIRSMLRLFYITWRRHEGEPMHLPRYRDFSGAVGESSVRVLGNRKHDHRGAIKRAYLSAFHNAKKQILITNSYFLPEREIRNGLRAASRRGVRVALLLAGKSDVLLVQMASRHFYEQLLEDGLELYEWNHSNLHAKTAVVDDAWSTVGSYNLNWRSMLHNLECNLIIEDAGVARSLETMFWDDVARSQVVDGSFVVDRPIAEDLGGRFAALFRKWL